MYKTGLYWFTNDLRVSDNPTLVNASNQSEKLLCVFLLDPRFRQPSVPQSSGLPSIIGARRYQFLYETLQDLKCSLADMGQNLLIIYEPPVQAISKLCETFNVDALFRSEHAGFYENRDWAALKRRCSGIDFKESPSHTLFAEVELPFQLVDLPPTFSRFRKMVEPIDSIELTPLPEKLAPPPLMDVDFIGQFKPFPKPGISQSNNDQPAFPAIEMATGKMKGGETKAQQHLQNYIDTKRPSYYKEVRNHLDGWENSTKISPWLSNGSLSVKQVISAVQSYEKKAGANESTYWIIFELLWREYFQWYAHRYKALLFASGGIKDSPVLTSFYANRFHSWCQGNTPYSIVNACMKQLNHTGYMSNRGRQIVASCFVNELGLDWRYGAAYFEQQLIDYDVAANWANWQYMAGVGADPRGKRHFDLDKQAQTYDSDQAFRKKWDCVDNPEDLKNKAELDVVDAADWPID